ncbi:putative peptidyl-prolyl isomerase cwc27 protein [Erysiphe necator]|uniref:peptidylprolyl isomerase n=1 Tax=Uncinula necator TaxID=52586 RepID=A0A0B1P108_UNCNE|nr:putative peptidyl-prolyl isomerase cwc27 protein [Erysiphe necator]
MSSLYNLEPQPTASCILHTTAGDIALELWASQLPLTCRNFLQHCIDGYYDNTIFHRLVPKFIIQGGDPTGTGNGGESIYDGGAYAKSREEGGIWPMEDRKGKNAGPNGIGFKDEFHSRIKFNRRGLLGMANDGPDSNGSQFFITLDSTPELQGKNTVFGRVQGETIYNVARMGEAEIGEGERPLYPIKITGVEVLVNFFKDMIKRERIAPVVTQVLNLEKKKKKKLDKKLLSFDDGTEDANEMQHVAKKRKYDSRIVADIVDELDPKPYSQTDSKKKIEIRKELDGKEKVNVEKSKISATKESISLESPPNITLEPVLRESSSPEPSKTAPSMVERTNAQIAELKASMKRKIQAVPSSEKKISIFESLIPATSTRGRKRNLGENIPPDPKTLEILKVFQSKLEQTTKLTADPELKSKPLESGSSTIPIKQIANGDEDEAILCDLHFVASCQSCSKWDITHDDGAAVDDLKTELNGTSWMFHTLKFKEDKLGKDLSYRKKAEEELVVIDPREKARSFKEEVKARREARSIGGTKREWDNHKSINFNRTSNHLNGKKKR